MKEVGSKRACEVASRRQCTLEVRVLVCRLLDQRHGDIDAPAGSAGGGEWADGSVEAADPGWIDGWNTLEE